jgi:hypothetical protein
MQSPHVSTSDVIDALGGTSTAAQKIGVRPQVISHWRVKGKFPAHTYIALRGLLEKEGIEAPDHLWRMKSGAAA